VPARFLRVHYNGAAHPLAKFCGLTHGANCQRFVFELLKHFGYEIAPMRSSELYADRIYTRRVSRVRPLDILMFNRDENPWGAHLALYLGDGRATHLAKAIGHPVVWNLQDFDCERYRVLVAIKRPVTVSRSSARSSP
jgi:lipoprotein Spr